mmetsp:Transcript_10974/g.24197  ORF Transcript_10974/g.24197 Transcript_10974/m.24197 type:complete len:330 (-) Transcript_10974:412-1401(-)
MPRMQAGTPAGVLPPKPANKVLEFLAVPERKELRLACKSYKEYSAKRSCLRAFKLRLEEVQKELDQCNLSRTRSLDFDLQQCINAQQITQAWLDLFDGLLNKMRHEMMRRQSACSGWGIFRLCCPGKSRPEALVERVQICQRILERARALQVVEMQLGNALQVDDCKRKEYCEAIRTSVFRSMVDVNRGTWIELRLQFLESILKQRTSAIDNMLKELEEGKYHQAYLDLQKEIQAAQVSLSDALPLADLLPKQPRTKAQLGSQECTVCLSPAEEDAIFLSCCKHCVHRECIARWLVCNGVRCPLCRSTQLQKAIEATMFGTSDPHEIKM